MTNEELSTFRSEVEQFREERSHFGASIISIAEEWVEFLAWRTANATSELAAATWSASAADDDEDDDATPPWERRR